MRRYIKHIVTLLSLVILVNLCTFARASSNSLNAVYDEYGMVIVTGNVSSNYAGLPAVIALKSKTSQSTVPLYINDTLIASDGKINFSFEYEIDNVSDYTVYLNIASVYSEDIQLKSGDIDEDITDISQLKYYDEGKWYNLDYASYVNLYETTATISASVPKTDGVVIFASKDSEGKLIECVFGEKYYSSRYKATLEIPKDGNVEIYCWNSMDTIKPNCSKAILPECFSQTLLFSENPDPIAENPGKGWVRYRSDYSETSDVLQYVSVGYNRFNWNQIEAKEGVYDWSVIDDFITKWANLGKKAAFGIAMASSTNSASYLTPKWVFDAGAKYTMANNGTQYVPVWDDAVYLAKLDDFTKALANRYDGDKRIAFIDIRSYGNFGEGHTSGLTNSVALSAEKEKLHIDIAKKYFTKTQLMVCTANTSEQGIKTDYAVNSGVGLRIDSILNGNYSETHRLDDAYGKEPTVFEFATMYSNMKSAADAYGSASYDNNHWNQDRYLSSFYVGKPSYMDLGQYNNDSASFVNDNRELIKLLSNKMGYHFVLESMNVPMAITAGATLNIDAKWINKGIAPLYEECYPAIAILDSNNNVIDKCWLDSFDPQSWLPNEEITESAKVKFNTITGNNIKLAIGLFTDKADSSPSYKIGNYNATSNKWYVIANGTKGENGYSLTQATQGSKEISTVLDDFYINKVKLFKEVADTTNIISDYSFEMDGCNWSPVKNLSSISKSTTNPHSGTYCGVITKRSDLWSGAQIDITDLLKKNGAGTYRFEGWFRTPTSRNVTVYPFRINSVTEYSFVGSVGSSWTKLTKDFEITEEQMSKLTHAVTLILGDDRGSSYNKNDIYFDDLSLRKIN